MGTRGPVPKRSEQRRRVNAPAIPIDRVDGAAMEAPPLALPGCHALAAALYESLASSPEARYYTPAVWQRARVSTFALSRLLKQPRMSSQMYAALQGDWRDLLVSPAEQRRLGIEVLQAPTGDVDEDKAVSQLDDYRRRLAEPS